MDKIVILVGDYGTPTDIWVERPVRVAVLDSNIDGVAEEDVATLVLFEESEQLFVTVHEGKQEPEKVEEVFRQLAGTDKRPKEGEVRRKEKFHCEFCDRAIVFVAAQSTDAGNTITWRLICEVHRQGWNEGGGWDAPIFKIGEREE